VLVGVRLQQPVDFSTPPVSQQTFADSLSTRSR
jgi:hypothetical protein